MLNQAMLNQAMFSQEKGIKFEEFERHDLSYKSLFFKKECLLDHFLQIA